MTASSKREHLTSCRNYSYVRIDFLSVDKYLLGGGEKRVILTSYAREVGMSFPRERTGREDQGPGGAFSFQLAQGGGDSRWALLLSRVCAVSIMLLYKPSTTITQSPHTRRLQVRLDLHLHVDLHTHPHGHLPACSGLPQFCLPPLAWQVVAFLDVVTAQLHLPVGS